MALGTVLNEIIQTLVGGISGIAQGIGTGLADLVGSIFLTTAEVDGVTTTTLSVFGGVICVFAGVSLAIGLSRWVVDWVTSFGN